MPSPPDNITSWRFTLLVVPAIVVASATSAIFPTVCAGSAMIEIVGAAVTSVIIGTVMVTGAALDVIAGAAMTSVVIGVAMVATPPPKPLLIPAVS